MAAGLRPARHSRRPRQAAARAARGGAGPSIGRAGAGFGLAAVGGDEALEITLTGERLRLFEKTVPRDLRLRIPAACASVGALESGFTVEP